MDGTTSAGGADRNKRGALLSAALELFSEQGFAGTTMRAVARAVGVRESAIYHHFDSKDALFLGVVEYVVERRSDIVLPEVERILDLPLRAGLTRLANLFVQHMSTVEERRFWRLMTTEGPRLHEIGFEARKVLLARPRAAFFQLHDALRRAGRMRDDVSPEIFMLHFIAPIVFAVNLYFAAGRESPPIPLARLVREHVEVTARAIETPLSAAEAGAQLNERSVSRPATRRRTTAAKPRPSRRRTS